MAHAVAKSENVEFGDDLEGFDELVNEQLDSSTFEDCPAPREASGVSNAAVPANSPLNKRSSNEIMIWRTQIPTKPEAVVADLCHKEEGKLGQQQTTVPVGTRLGGSSALGNVSSIRSGNTGMFRRLGSNLTDGIKKRMGSIGFGRNSSLRRGSRSYEASSYNSPSQGLQTMASVLCTFEGHETGSVEVYSAPVKTIERMREKVLEYATEGCGEGWPLCANILDPVRASVVCRGPAQILQVLQWFAGSCPARTSEAQETVQNGAAVRLLPLCRVKNKFAFPKEELVGG